MLHTAHFYIDLTKEELNLLENHLGVSYKNIGRKADEYCNGIITWITKGYATRLHFIVDFIKLLEKANILESDFYEVEKRIKGYLYFLFLDQQYYGRVVMLRIDYRLDVHLPKDQRITLLYLYKKTADKHRHQKKYDQYKTTVYFNSKSIQATCYDKEAEVSSDGRTIENYELDVLRFEVRLQNSHLKDQKYRKRKEKWLEEYFRQDLYEKYMHQYLETIIYKGDYYKIFGAKRIINDSDLKGREKEQLLDFLRNTSRYGLENTKKKTTRYHFNKLLKQLEQLKINPILIPRDRLDFPSFIKNPFNIEDN